MDYKGKKIIIVGLGKTGLSCLAYFCSSGVWPRVMDTRETRPEAMKLDQRIETHFGGLRRDWLLEADLIILSPGIPKAHPLLQQAAVKGIEIISDIELFCREINKKKDKKIVGITGSNGKTTVTTLVGNIAKAAGIRTGVGGNIGVPALSLLEHDVDLYVLELSSFQLEMVHSLKPTVATILNISEDHMDRYPLGIKQYIAAKQRIYQHASCCVINQDDSLTYPLTGGGKQRVFYGRSDAEYALDANATHIMVKGEPILSFAETKLVGLHNYINALAALAIADALGIDRSITLLAIKQFSGLPHRFELVHKHNGVCWINDSKATNVGSTKAALNSVRYQGHLFLLLGGLGKAADFSPLQPELCRKNLTIYTFGHDSGMLAALRPDITIEMHTLREAVEHLARFIKPGDVVLLSPACASLDQFKDYIERGNTFSQLAKEFGQ